MLFQQQWSSMVQKPLGQSPRYLSCSNFVGAYVGLCGLSLETPLLGQRFEMPSSRDLGQRYKVATSTRWPRGQVRACRTYTQQDAGATILTHLRPVLKRIAWWKRRLISKEYEPNHIERGEKDMYQNEEYTSWPGSLLYVCSMVSWVQDHGN